MINAMHLGFKPTNDSYQRFKCVFSESWRHYLFQSTYKEGHVRGLVDICLRIQKEALATSGSSWLTDDYIKGLMLDTVVAGKHAHRSTVKAPFEKK